MSGTKKPGMQIQMTVNRASRQTAPDAEWTSETTPTFHAVILGDFSGRENKNQVEPATIHKRRLLAIDRDNYEAILEKFDIVLNLGTKAGASVLTTVPVTSIDDFHPDQLFQRIDLFRQLRDLRKRLQNNSTFQQAAAEMQSWSDVPARDIKPTVVFNESEIQPVSLDSILDNATVTATYQDSDAKSRTGSALVDNLIRQIVAPHIEAAADPRQDELIDVVDAAITASMRQILHHADFQALESAWRAVEFLLRRVESGETIKIYLLDISKSELKHDLLVDDITNSGLYRKFCDPAAGDRQFNLMLGNYRFEPGLDDILLLKQLGEVAASAGTVFLAGASEKFSGCESLLDYPDSDDWNHTFSTQVQQAWQWLRDSDVADNLALVSPRVVMRRAYGTKLDTVESFAFEELSVADSPATLLWGNGAFIVAEQLMREITEQCHVNETCRLPLNYLRQSDEQLPVPCAEIYLTERGSRKFYEQGLIALQSVKDSDCVRSSNFRTLARD